jgi:1-acyl-sn-glycerol-3-phosphate acyltransferase
MMLKTDSQLLEKPYTFPDPDHEVHAAIRSDMLRAFRLDRLPLLGPALGRALHFPIRRLTRTVLDYDAHVGRHGLADASGWLVDQFAARVDVHGANNVPATGPLLIVSNHPGIIDAMAIFAHLGRADLRVVAAERPVLRLLRHIDRYLFYVPDLPAQRLRVVREVTQHLREGGAVLTFPGGQIEPDPARFGDAAARLASWSESIDLFARMVPEVRILPIVVGGVLSPSTLRHPLARLHRSRKDREWAAASLQILLRRRHDVHVRLVFGEPVSISKLADGPGSSLVGCVSGQMGDLMARYRETMLL